MYLSADAAQQHRSRLINQLDKGDLLVVPAAVMTQRNSDVQHRFRQNSDFYYLTAFGEPDAVAVIYKEGEEAQFTLFVLPKDPEREVWDGFRCGVEGATERFGADQAFSIQEIDGKMPELLDGAQRVIYPMSHSGFEARMAGWRKSVQSKVRLGASCPSVFVDLGSILHELRLIKTDHEL